MDKPVTKNARKPTRDAPTTDAMDFIFELVEMSASADITSTMRANMTPHQGIEIPNTAWANHALKAA